MSYQKQTWSDTASSGTPITAARMNHIEAGIKANSDAWDSVSQQVGFIKITPDESGVSKTVHVAFSPAFVAAPCVQLTAYSSVPQNVHVSVSDVTKSGFDIVLNRVGAVETRVNWQAVAM